MLEARRLPRFMNRGLIEARSSARENDTVSELPRFMNRGLIEATGRPATAARCRWNFPDS